MVGNGDVSDRAHAERLAETYRLDGVMIGRGVFRNPFCFAPDAPAAWEATGRTERLALFRRQVEAFAAAWQPGERNIKTLNKFCKVYINGFDGAKELRERLMAAGSTDELLAILA